MKDFRNILRYRKNKNSEKIGVRLKKHSLPALARGANMFLVLLIPLVISGCATTTQERTDTEDCGIGSIFLGSAAGAVVSKNPIMVVPWVATGAVLGNINCGEKDTDGDGVPDDKDQCPDTKGSRICEKPTAPHPDADDMFNCWNQQSELEGIRVDENGCPVDSDGDGVSDYWDQCLNTQQGINSNNKGCGTEFGIEIIDEKCEETLANLQHRVHFNFDKCHIRHEDEYILDGVAKALDNTNTRIRIEGHADNRGRGEYNLRLSQCRADEVGYYLVSHGLLDTNIAATEGKGEDFPIMLGKTEKAWRKNRRVEIICE
uniref:OmpA-OmpF porin, OOP family n=1 Tax=Candidatus Kentrum sp. TUN TaxID=2126343 RepID=A0A450ZBM4_9GAMM|nr:MAG: OmpA-OmpF porin, OOP family [Candidatus Kentron sp. TUN]VFK54489.1 MAG: OmpA-OmpF porin, OOP family [Candidatus Kentron sp. TUN]